MGTPVSPGDVFGVLRVVALLVAVPVPLLNVVDDHHRRHEVKEFPRRQDPQIPRGVGSSEPISSS